ncbi:hypothetical protein ACP4OV_026382 [Aristida adscensionis]
MEAIQGNLVEGGVLWLAQCILASLLLDKMEAWLRKVELADDAERLRSEVERVEAVADSVKGKAAGSRPLARSLGRLKELLYDADDLVDELDYFRLQHQVEGGDTFTRANEPEGADESRDNADILGSSSMGSRRSMYWKEFRVTELSDMLPYSPAGDMDLNDTTAAAGNSVCRKRMRTDEASMHDVATSTHPSTDTEFRSRIQQITLQLQKATSDILKLYGPDSTVCSNPYRSTSKNTHRRTSSIVQRKMYGRVAEKNSIINLMTVQKSDGITVLPIVGIGGIGKTALAQRIYNDQVVKDQFKLRIWVWVSKYFDEVRLTREMLDFVSREKHEGISSLAKLQEILIGCFKSDERFLLILDDVWDSTEDHIWNKLIAPLKSVEAKGNVIVVTTRSLSVAKRVGTVKTTELVALEKDEFWLLFKTCAFGDDQYEGHQSLNIIGQQIEEKLHGNPLAAETAGMLLRDNLTIDHWSSTLKKETWKSLQLNNGIMNALKLSFDELPYSLQQCLLHCSIFPQNHQFISNKLIYVWISQGFVKYDHPARRLEDIGRDYLSVLVSSGFFELFESDEGTAGDQTCYLMPALMHDFLRLVSRAEYAVIDGSECSETLPNIRHLSVITDSAYHEDHRGYMTRNEKFEGNLQRVVKSVRKLRTLLLIGKYDHSFLLKFQDIFQKARCLRVLQISATDLDFFLPNNSAHLRYLKLENEGSNEALPAALNKSCHLQVLDVGHPAILDSMTGLVSMRHLAVKKKAKFMDQNSIYFEMTQLQPMCELVHLCVDQLQNVTRDEASAAKLRDKQQLEMLHLSWTYNTLPLDKDLMHAMFGGAPCTEQYDSITERDVLEGLEPHHNLKHLRISGHNGATSPAWFGASVSVTCLQTLNLKDCRQWELNSSLKVLKIENCEVLENFTLFDSCEKLKIKHKSWLPRLNELTVHGCPHLKVLNPLPPASDICKISVSGISTHPMMRGTSNGKFIIGEHFYSYYYDWLEKLDEQILSFHNLRALTHLEIQGCRNLLSISLKGFSQLISLKSLEIRDCESLFSSHVLSKHIHEDMAGGNFSVFPSLQYLMISSCGITGKWVSVMLRNAPALGQLALSDCQQISGLLIEGQEISWPSPTSAPQASSPGNTDGPLPSSTQDEFLCIPLNLIPSLREMSISSFLKFKILTSKEGFSGFTSLEKLTICRCSRLMASLVHKDVNGDCANGRWLLPHSLVQLKISYSQETLQPCFPDSLTALKTLVLWESPYLQYLQLCTCTALEVLSIKECRSLGALEGLQSLHSLRSLQISKCRGLTSLHLHSCAILEELIIRECNCLEALVGFESLGCLRNLEVSDCTRLESIMLRSCTALEELETAYCYSLQTLEGFESLGCLRNMKVTSCPGLPPYLEHLSRQVDELCPQLERLLIDDCSFLTASFCKHLISLQRLRVWGYHNKVTGEQESALQLLTSLQELEFRSLSRLADLMGLHNLLSPKRLVIRYCEGISRLPEKGLPPSLEELEVEGCRNDLNEQCRAIAASKIMVKIDGNYVN